MTDVLKQAMEEMLRAAGVMGKIELTVPPKSDMGDFAFPCFAFAKDAKKNPTETAKELAAVLAAQPSGLVQEVKAFGPYVNFFLNGTVVAERVLGSIFEKGDVYGQGDSGQAKKVLVEYGCPNPLKAFHLGHLRNLISGESVARVLENAGYAVKRVNYQGDVGMHVAKTLWAIDELRNEFESIGLKPLPERIAFLGRAYAHGATAFESDESAQKAIAVYNEKVYDRDASIAEVYQTTRQWSLDYFESIYKKLGTTYDQLYFESGMYERGVTLVKEFLAKGVFAEGEGGAIIFPGSQFGLHDRVFINGKGYPTYEAKEVALAERHFADHEPDQVIHVVGKEQTEYFKVVIKAIEAVVPASQGKEHHLVGGYLQLKGEQKMSSRKGNVVTGDDLLSEVEDRVWQIMSKEGSVEMDKTVHETLKKVSAAALKYTMLKSGVSDDIAFDMERSVSTEGDSGPYLLYIVARIHSILRKAEMTRAGLTLPHTAVEPAEKRLLVTLAAYPDMAALAADTLDPSHVAQYLFDLAQRFNTFYHECPVLSAAPDVQAFRLSLIQAVERVMTSGLGLLGIETVEAM